MKSMRQKWLESFGPDKEVYKLSEKGDTAEYLTRDKPNGDPYGRMPVFHVWKGDNWLYCGASQKKADEVYEKALRDTTTKMTEVFE